MFGDEGDTAITVAFDQAPADYAGGFTYEGQECTLIGIAGVEMVLMSAVPIAPITAWACQPGSFVFDPARTLTGDMTGQIPYPPGP